MNRQTKIVCEEYLQWVRSQSCCVCGRTPVDPDHLKARGRGEAKRNDFTAIPLCREHHSERGQLGDEKFQEECKINLWEEVAYRLMRFWIYRVNHGVNIEFGKI